MEKIVSDLDLWLAFQKGDRASFAQIYQLHVDDLLNYGYRVTPNKQIIKDSIQDLFLHLWMHRENLTTTTSIKFYLFRALRNKILRNSDHLTSSLDNDDAIVNSLFELPIEYTLTLQELETEQTQRLQNAITILSPRQKEVINLRYHNDFSLEEISQIMQLSNQSVRNVLHRAVSQLRHHFEVAGWCIYLFLTFF